MFFLSLEVQGIFAGEVTLDDQWQDKLVTKASSVGCLKMSGWNLL